MNKKKIFFSYTLRDHNINLSFLQMLRSWVEKENLDTYIDILDNEYNSNDFQKKLLTELRTSDIFFIINTPQYKNSTWTNIELKEATALGLIIVDIDKKELENIIHTKTFDYLLENYNKTLLMPV